MPVTTYTVIEGEVVSQNQNGTIHDFLPDPLGNTLALIAADESIEFDWDYFPYEQVATVWDGATALRYGGTRGYCSDNYSRPHVGARELRTIHGRWMQVDPMWPHERAYRYVNGSPVTQVDPTGLAAESCWPLSCDLFQLLWCWCTCNRDGQVMKSCESVRGLAPACTCDSVYPPPCKYDSPAYRRCYMMCKDLGLSVRICDDLGGGRGACVCGSGPPGTWDGKPENHFCSKVLKPPQIGDLGGVL